MDILTYINRMNQIYGNGPAPAPRYNTQQYLQGGRVGYQAGQLVQPGPGRQGYGGKGGSSPTYRANLIANLPKGYKKEYTKLLLNKTDKGFSRKGGELMNIQGKKPLDYLADKYKIKRSKIKDINSAILDSLNQENKLKSADLGPAKIKAIKRKINALGPLYRTVGGTPAFHIHEMYPVGGDNPIRVSEMIIISKETNSKLSPYDKSLNNYADEVFEATQTFNKNKNLESYKKSINKINEKASKTLSDMKQKLPKNMQGFLGWRKPSIDNAGDITFKNTGVTQKSNISVNFKDEFFKDLTQEKRFELKKQVKNLAQENPKQLETITKMITSLCPNKASGGRVGMALAGSAGLECGKKQLQKHLIKGTGTQAERGTIAKIVQGGSNLMKGLSPKEILKLRNLIGPAALAFEAGIGAGMIGYDVLRKNIPIKEALGKNWLTGWAMPRSEKEYQIDDMRKQGLLLNPGAKTYAQGLELSARYERLADVLSKFEDPVAGYRKINPKIATELGVESIADIEKEMEKTMNEYNKLTREGTVMEEGSGAQLEFMQDFTEFEAKRATPNLFGELGAKEKISTTGEREGPRGIGVVQKEPVRIDQRQFDLPETYEKVSLSETPIDEKTMRDMRDVYRQYGILKPRDELPPEYVDYFQRKEKFNQAMKLPGMLGTQERFKSGGRVSFSKGSFTRRGFLKLLAALGIGTATAGTGLIKLGGKAATKTAVKTGVDIATGTQGMPSWFPALVNKVIKEGDDVTSKLATKDRQIVHTKKLGDPNDVYGDEVTVYRDLDTGDIRVESYSGSNMGEAPIQMEYKAPSVIDEGKMAGQKTDPEFSAVETEPRVTNWDGDIEFDGDNIVGSVDDLMSDTTKVKNYAEGKKPTIKEIVTSKKKKDVVKNLHDDQTAQMDYIEQKTGHLAPEDLMDYDDYLPGIDDID